MMNLYGNYGHSWGWSPMYLGVGAIGLVLGLAVIVVVLVLKGYALWYAAKRDEKYWFIALFIVNTFGILELVYLFCIVKKWKIPGASGPKKPDHNHNHLGASRHTGH